MRLLLIMRLMMRYLRGMPPTDWGPSGCPSPWARLRATCEEVRCSQLHWTHRQVESKRCLWVWALLPQVDTSSVEHDLQQNRKASFPAKQVMDGHPIVPPSATWRSEAAECGVAHSMHTEAAPVTSGSTSKGRTWSCWSCPSVSPLKNHHVRVCDDV